MFSKQYKCGVKAIPCSQCGKEFNTKQAMKLHMKKSCKPISLQNTQERLDLLEQENRALKEKLDTFLALCKAPTVNTNCHNTNTVVTNINIQAFRQEDITHLLENRQFMDTIVKRREKGVLELIKATYFDRDQHPENMNVRVTNYKMPYIDTYDGKRWLKCDKEDVLEDLLESSCSHIDEHYEDTKEVLLEAFSASFVELMHEFMERVKDRDQHTAFFDALKQRIHLLIINESKAT